jgi:hypothetical protein
MSILTILTTVYLTVATVIAVLLILDDRRTRGDIDYGLCIATGIFWIPAVPIVIYVIRQK